MSSALTIPETVMLLLLLTYLNTFLLGVDRIYSDVDKLHSTQLTLIQKDQAISNYNSERIWWRLA